MEALRLVCEIQRQRLMLLCLIGGGGVLSHFPPTFVGPTRLISSFSNLWTGTHLHRFDSSLHDNGLILGWWLILDFIIFKWSMWFEIKLLLLISSPAVVFLGIDTTILIGSNLGTKHKTIKASRYGPRSTPFLDGLECIAYMYITDSTIVPQSYAFTQSKKTDPWLTTLPFFSQSECE